MYIGRGRRQYFLGRFLGKFASQEWKIIINEEQITISNEAKKYHIPFNKTQITYCGENGFRILKFSSDIVVRLTVGTHFLTPFSTNKDIEVIDQCGKALDEILSNKQFVIKRSPENRYRKRGSFKIRYRDKNG